MNLRPLKTLTFKKNLLEKYTTLNNLSKEIIEICEISIELNDENDLPNIIHNFETLQSLHSEISIQLKLNGKFDSRNAIIGIKQGAGGIDAQDWAEILVRMYNSLLLFNLTYQIAFYERSQLLNKELAMKILQSRIMEVEIIKNQQKEAEIKGEHISADFGSQIRSYVMHPYKLVKDHRTNAEQSNVEEVLDGNIDSFIESYLIGKIK